MVRKLSIPLVKIPDHTEPHVHIWSRVRRSARLLTNGLCRRDKRRVKAVRPRISGPRATLRPARSDLASWKNLVLWAFLGVLTGCVNRLTLSVKAYLGP